MAGLTERQIAETDLAGGYPELQPQLERLPARIVQDRGAAHVEVMFDPALPPRIARYTPGRGCTQLPVGARADAVRLPPAPEGMPNLKATDARPWPLGMTRTTAETDWKGNFILSSQVWMTARDMARLALLHLNDGMVGETRLLPRGWVAAATSPVGPQPEPGTSGSARPGRQGYGRAIWLLGNGDGLPPGSYAFLGNRGQIAIIVPARNLVVVRRGFDLHGVAFDGPALAKDVLAAIGE